MAIDWVSVSLQYAELMLADSYVLTSANDASARKSARVTLR